MTTRPSRTALTLLWIALAAAISLAIFEAPRGDWNLALLATLLALSILSDLLAIKTRVHRVVISASFLTIVTAAALLGAAAAALIGVVTILAGWLRHRYESDFLLINLVTYAWFPLVGAIAFHRIVDAAEVGDLEPAFYLLVLALFTVALTINFALIAGYSAYVERSRFAPKVRRGLTPLLSSELAAGVLALGIVFAYTRLGAGAVLLFGVTVLVFQWLIGALLVSQDRADELELRAKQLAGFQVALLSAVLRTLDLRDRMTARHSAAVARYARELATAVGLSDEQQELAHTAGLLHDIGKFVLPDTILKARRRELTDVEWREIKKHPYEGARIVSQIDGYQPISEIILTHHERIDGSGYPRQLVGDEIPVLARVIAVVDAYDAMTARDSYREPLSSYDAVIELRRASGSQFDPELVEAFIGILDGKDLAYRHGDADFEAELALDKRIHDYISASS